MKGDLVLACVSVDENLSVKVDLSLRERQTTWQTLEGRIQSVGHMKRKKAEPGRIWPETIKNTAFSSFTFFTLEKMNRIEKVEGVGERGRERERVQPLPH